MTALDKLNIVREFILKKLLPEIKEEFIDDERPFMKISFFKGIVLYIRYNDYEEYSYQLNYSQDVLDRIRYDNYDNMWGLDSKPNHLHPKGQKTAIESPINGDPKQDIPILLEELDE